MSGAPAGRGIVITRPAGESQRLAALIRDAGAVPLLYPAIEICDALDPQPLEHAIQHLDEFDIAIFISPSAVEKAMTRIQARCTLPARLKCAAIGPGGVRALQKFGVSDVIAPACGVARHDSEALLAAPQLQHMQGQRVVIFRGDGGRELLSETLIARGAMVVAVTCYRRRKPAFDAAELNAVAQRGSVAAVIITSSEGLRNLCAHLGADGVAWLSDLPIIVPHPRIAAVARELGLQQVVETVSGDEVLAAAALRFVHLTAS
jgi:uroporphyrinogen-III synthase